MKRLWRLLTACALSSTLAFTGCSGGGSAVTTPSGVLNSQPQSLPQTKMTVTVTRTTKANTPSLARRIQDIPAGTNAIEIDAYPGTQSVPASGKFFTPPSGIIPITTCANFPQSQSSITLSAQIPIGPATVVISTYSGACSNNVASGSILSQAVGTGIATAAGGDLGATFFGTTAGGAIILAVPTPKPYSIAPLSNVGSIESMNSKGDLLVYLASGQSAFGSAPNYSFTYFPTGMFAASLSNNDEVVAIMNSSNAVCNSSGTTCQPLAKYQAAGNGGGGYGSGYVYYACTSCHLNSNGIVVGAIPLPVLTVLVWQTNLMGSASPAPVTDIANYNLYNYGPVGNGTGYLNYDPIGDYVINDSNMIAGLLHGQLTIYSIQSGGISQTLGNVPGGHWAQPYAINSSGHIVGYDQTGQDTIAFFADPNCSFLSGCLLDLGVLPGMSSAQATAINDNDQIVGSSCVSMNSQPCHPFITSPNSTMIDINSLLPLNSGWYLTGAVGIDNAGDIAVQGNHNGQVQFAILHPQ